MAGGAHHFNKNNKGVNVSYRNFIPKRNNHYGLKPYEKILLKGFIAIIPINKTTKAFIYANGAKFKINNQEKDTLEIINKELLNMIKSVEILKA